MRLARRFAACAVLAPVLVGGCYSYSGYALDRPAPGLTVEVTLNDRGRVAMEQNIGPEVLTVEGTALNVTDSTFVLRVRRVVDISRRASSWSGEPVAFRVEHVRQMRERRFSTGRTVLFAGTVTASVVAFAATRAILGWALGSSGPRGTGSTDSPDN